MNKRMNMTKGERKVAAFFEHIVRTDMFVKNLDLARRVNDIPVNGFKIDKSSDVPPVNWLKSHDKQDVDALEKYADDVCEVYGLDVEAYSVCILSYIFYNKFVIPKSFADFNLLQLFDNENSSPFFPIEILVSPYASLRDIIDFVTRNYKAIKKRQNKYVNPNVRIGKYKYRNRDNLLIYDYIYNNRKLSLLDLSNNVNTKFNKNYGYEDIAKMLSIERKRRKV